MDLYSWHGVSLEKYTDRPASATNIVGLPTLAVARMLVGGL